MDKMQNSLIEKKLYMILISTGCIANTLGFIANALIYGLTLGTWFCGACAVLLIIIGHWGFNIKNRWLAELIILILIVFMEFPFLYYVYGKSTFVYMVLGIVATATFIKGNLRKVMIILEIIFDVAIILIAHFYPSTLEVITEGNSIGSTICSYLIVAVSVSIMLTLLVKQYTKQQQELLKMGLKLEAAAKLDPLTDLYNRRYLTEYLDGRIRNRKERFTIALLDLDDFKNINDTYGHMYGDQVLKTFGDILKNNISSHGIVARFGGEEFMVVFDSTDKDKIQRIMELSAMELKQYSLETKGVEISFSGGVEEVHNEDRITIMFNSADEKLYKAKKNGKNNIVFA